MGRQLKRVPLSFNWPINQTWEGYLNPYSKLAIKCPHCGGGGYSPDYRYLESLWYSHLGGGFKPEDRGSVPYLPDGEQAQAWATRHCGRNPEYYGNDTDAINREAARICDIWNSSWSHHLNEADVAALLKADRLWDFTRRPRPGTRKNAAKHPNGWLKKGNGYVPTPREVNDWSLCGFGHDSINSWIVIKAELKRLKLPSTCPHCKGKGSTWPSDRVRRQHSAWKPKEPPKGEAYQVWETVSEGSPISPPFATPEALATHMATTRWGADEGTPYETWMRFICGSGWAPTMMTNASGALVSGVEGMSEIEGKALETVAQ